MQDSSVSEILNALRVLVHALQVGSRTSQERVGLTGAQLFVLEKLRDVSGMTVNELAAATHTHQSTVSVVVSKLVEKGLVSRIRSDEDARVQQLSITKRGESKFVMAPDTIQDRLINSLKKWPDSDQKNLSFLLTRLISDAELGGIKPELFLEKENKK